MSSITWSAIDWISLVALSLFVLVASNSPSAIVALVRS